MLPSELFDIYKLRLVFQTPIAMLLLITFIVSLVLYYFVNFIYLKKLLASLTLLIFLGIFTFYFGILPTLKVFLILIGSITIGVKILKFEYSFIALIIGFLALIDIYILIA